MNAHAQVEADAKPAIIVFGKDEGGKAHASSFHAGELDLARKAAALMRMSSLVVATDAEQAIAAKVPKGRVFASGKAFVPFISAKLFAEITKLHEQACGESGTESLADTRGEIPANADAAVAGPPPQPKDWTEIAIGTIVLASIAPRHTEWFECLVVGDDGHDTLTMRFCDWPQEAPFERHRNDLALMHPTRQVEPPVAPEQPAEAA